MSDIVSNLLSKNLTETELVNYLTKYKLTESEIAFFCYYNKNLKKYKICDKNWKYDYNKKSLLVYSYYQNLLYSIFLSKNGYTVIPLNYFLGIMTMVYLLTKNVNKKEEVKKTITKISKSKKKENNDDKYKVSYKLLQPYVTLLETHLKDKI